MTSISSSSASHTTLEPCSVRLRPPHRARRPIVHRRLPLPPLYGLVSAAVVGEDVVPVVIVPTIQVPVLLVLLLLLLELPRPKTYEAISGGTSSLKFVPTSCGVGQRAVRMGSIVSFLRIIVVKILAYRLNISYACHNFVSYRQLCSFT